MNCKICDKEKYQHRHRIISGKYGGKYKPCNVVEVCATCHTKIHTGEIIIEGNFLTTAGYVTFWHYRDEPSITGMEKPNTVHTYKPNP